MYQRILVPVDGSATSGRGLHEAIALARLTHARLCLVHVVDELSFIISVGYGGFAGDVLGTLRSVGAQLLETAAGTVRAAGLECETVLCDSMSGRLHEQVAEQASKWHADLIVLGTHGRRGVGRLVLGSGAEQILRTATVPVLLVRDPEPVVAAEDGKPSMTAEHKPPAAPHVNLPHAALAIERV